MFLIVVTERTISAPPVSDRESVILRFLLPVGYTTHHLRNSGCP